MFRYALFSYYKSLGSHPTVSIVFAVRNDLHAPSVSVLFWAFLEIKTNNWIFAGNSKGSKMELNSNAHAGAAFRKLDAVLNVSSEQNVS